MSIQRCSESIRKYILEIRKALGDRPDNPEFIETLPKRGYRFVASVQDASAPEPPIVPTPHGTEEQAMEENVALATAPSEEEGSSAKAVSINKGSNNFE
jgi:DNA-binding winged helix-turn-helix (wHTH) protein